MPPSFEDSGLAWATSRYARVAPSKVRQVLAHIRGRRVEEAQRILLLSPKAVAEQVHKTLNSAIANAEHNHGLDADDLVVAVASCDEGPILKRFQPRAMGRAYRVRKRTSHISIAVGAPERAGQRGGTSAPRRTGASAPAAGGNKE